MKNDSARSQPTGRVAADGRHGRLAGAASLAACSGSPASAPGTGAEKPAAQRINVLTRALTLMQRDYGTYRLEAPGPEDVLDYQVGDLWKRGIDGTGTTIAVIEAWKGSPLIAKFVASRDKQLGLPNPQIQTIYPTGRHRLPATCRRVEAKLGDYGSCGAWEGEAVEDVVSAHMLAPTQDLDRGRAAGQRDHRRYREPGGATRVHAGGRVRERASPGQRDLDQRRQGREHLLARARRDPRTGPR